MLPGLFPLLERLAGDKVAFVVVGGVAVVAHGAIRTTQDLNIVPDQDRENLRILGNTLVDLNATLASDPRNETSGGEATGPRRSRRST
jgi:hypothetical protein